MKSISTKSTQKISCSCADCYLQQSSNNYKRISKQPLSVIKEHLSLLVYRMNIYVDPITFMMSFLFSVLIFLWVRRFCICVVLCCVHIHVVFWWMWMVYRMVYRGLVLYRNVQRRFCYNCVSSTSQLFVIAAGLEDVVTVWYMIWP